MPIAFQTDSTVPTRAYQAYLILIGRAANQQTIQYRQLCEKMNFGIGPVLAAPLDGDPARRARAAAPVGQVQGWRLLAHGDLRRRRRAMRRALGAGELGLVDTGGAGGAAGAAAGRGDRGGKRRAAPLSRAKDGALAGRPVLGPDRVRG